MTWFRAFRIALAVLRDLLLVFVLGLVILVGARLSGQVANWAPADVPAAVPCDDSYPDALPC